MRVLLLLVLALPALGNITTAAITGRVMIEGTPASGVSVTVSSTALQQPRTTITNASGRYWLGELPPGEYDVTFSLEGHTTLTRRATLELARVARADATLEPNPDEDSVTSTTKTVSVADTIFPTTHFDDGALDRLPTGRIGSASLAPGPSAFFQLLDGVPSGAVTSEETIEQVTVVNGVSPVEWQTFAGSVTALRTRSGSEEFAFTLRDTITSSGWNEAYSPFFPEQDDGVMHFGEATFGGRIVPQRLWFFAAAWRGEEAYPFAQERDGSMVEIDTQLGAAHHVGLGHNETSQGFGFLPFESDTTSLHYTGAFGARFTADALAARTTTGMGGSSDPSSDFYSGRAAYAHGDHVLTAGFAAGEGEGPDYTSLFASDRWSVSRFNVYAGLRYDDGEFANRLSPRIAVSYDLHGNGSRAIVATWGEYAAHAQPQSAFRVMSLGAATALGNAGSARVDFVRRKSGIFWQHDFQLDARYRLFDRFEAGATYTLNNRYESPNVPPAFPDQLANVWLGAEVPVGSHELGVTVLQHYAEYSIRTIYPTDLALRYAIPFSRVGLLFAADGTNVFQQGDVAVAPRAWRLWVRLRV